MLARVMHLSIDEKVDVRLRARQNARRFSEAAFAKEWITFMESLVRLEMRKRGKEQR